MEFNICPKCGHPMVFVEGAERCLFCKYTEAPITEAVKPRRFIIENNEEIATLAAKNLENNLDGSKDYCLRRGITERAIKDWRIGYIPESFPRLSYPWARRILFPIYSNDGKSIIAFGGRKITTDDRPKYINSSESREYNKRTSLFGLSNLPSKTEVAYLCEGQVDVISMDVKGFAYPVASLGTSLTPEQANVLRRRVNRVVICYDSDEPGQIAAIRAVKVLHQAGFKYEEISVLFIEGAKDIDEALQHGCSVSELSVQEYMYCLKKYDEAALTMIY